MSEIQKSKKSLLWGLAITIVAVMAAGGAWTSFAKDDRAQGGEQQGVGAPQAMPVPALVVESQPVQIWKEFSGQLSAVNVAHIRPQVGGTITEVKFDDGQNVKKDDVLFVIDPRPYEAAVKQREAEVTAAKNRSDLAWKELKRAKDLIKSKAISQRILDERRNRFMVEKASVEAAEAALEQAKLNIDYAYVKAPFDGKVSQVEVTAGNLVQPGPNAPVLTTLVSNDAIYADFEVDESTYLNFVRNNGSKDQKIPVQMSLNSGDKTYDGFIHSFDNRIDPASGTIRARALFTNEDASLLPGMFAHVKIGSAQKQDKIFISDRAIGTNQDRKFVYAIGDDGTAAYREIKIGETMRGQSEIVAGLEIGETIIADGIIRIRPGMPVSPQINSESQ